MLFRLCEELPAGALHKSSWGEKGKYGKGRGYTPRHFERGVEVKSPHGSI